VFLGLQEGEREREKMMMQSQRDVTPVRAFSGFLPNPIPISERERERKRER